ncbi:ABC transporter [Rathayibacter tritici]|uniref:Transport permease protein n=1 Tax=Rathayibacter tritici TaxID=33888 RepID=A0A160KVZ6_9MICO|nr:ABC transporter permease [Rathayibacter tritici]AND17884.1 ABC transporter [Rathayibacter tritici]PPF30562.1 ABC transporter [Rathayibacter tritici]PPF66683.1 ABC transporter [Rathayibacter tritici]PPG09068.1 ABC transporter [Rathayibacter tritici]PPI17860.1 ABC transporter [Rathayibacter tritici]
MNGLAPHASQLRTVGRSGAVVERSMRVARRSIVPLVSGFFEPFFYLLALGVGLGFFIDDVQVDGRSVPYGAFVAPALLASSAMNGAIYDSTYNVFFKMRFAKLYDAMIATPLRPFDIALGEICWSLIRGAAYGAGFLLVMLAMGLITSAWAFAALPALVLVSFGFAAAGMAVTTFVKSFQHLDWVTAALIPMFFFSTSFFPLSVYPAPVQPIVQALPLYHAIELMRALTLGIPDAGILVHIGYFMVMSVAGIWLVSRRLHRILQP